jgi:hypothetical protein
MRTRVITINGTSVTVTRTDAPVSMPIKGTLLRKSFSIRKYLTVEINGNQLPCLFASLSSVKAYKNLDWYI